MRRKRSPIVCWLESISVKKFWKLRAEGISGHGPLSSTLKLFPTDNHSQKKSLVFSKESHWNQLFVIIVRMGYMLINRRPTENELKSSFGSGFLSFNIIISYNITLLSSFIFNHTTYIIVYILHIYFYISFSFYAAAPLCVYIYMASQLSIFNGIYEYANGFVSLFCDASWAPVLLFIFSVLFCCVIVGFFFYIV